MPSLAIKLRAITLALLACIVLTHSALAAVYYVRKSGSNTNTGLRPDQAFLTLTKAISTAAAGDVIYVGAGTYAENLASGTGFTIIGDIDGFATGDAGAVIVSASSGLTLSITAGTWTINDLTIRNSGTTSGNSPVKVTTGTVTFNRLTIDTGGYSAIWIVGGTVTINNSSISNYKEGGIYMSAGTCNANASKFFGATGLASAGDGDGISVLGGTLTMDRCRTGGHTNVGIWVNGGSATLRNCLIDNNANDGSWSDGGTLTFNHCTIVKNSGNGVYVQGTNTTYVYNSIVAYNGLYGLRRAAGTLTANTYLTFSNTSGARTGTITTSGQLTTDPLFWDRTNNDFRIAWNSPAVNASAVLGTINYDLDYRGLSRSRCATKFAIGAFDYANFTAASLPCSYAFEDGVVPSAFPTGMVQTGVDSTFTKFLGRYANCSTQTTNTSAKDGQTLVVATTIGQSYVVKFDAYLIDNWGTENFETYIDGQLTQTITLNTASATSSYAYLPAVSTNWAFAANNDYVYRQIALKFTATSTNTYITWRSNLAGPSTSESWGVDNISVASWSAPATPYTQNFSAPLGPEWSGQDLIETNDPSARVGAYCGPMGINDTTYHRGFASLTLSTTANQTYYCAFDLVLGDTWDGRDTTYGPDTFAVYVNGTKAWENSLQNWGFWMDQSYPGNPDEYGNILGNSGADDSIYRRIYFQFTAAGSTTRIQFIGLEDSSIPDEFWGIDNVAVCATNASSLFSYIPRFVDVTTAMAFDAKIETDNNYSGGIHPGDFNNDGYTDFIVGGITRSVLFMYTPATGKYTSSTFGSGTVLYQGAMIDFDGDGKLDYFGFDNTGTHTFYQNNGAGVFTNRGSLSLAGPTNRIGCAAVDINADGRTDILVFDSASGGKNYAGINTAPGTGATLPTFPANITTLPNTSSDTGTGFYTTVADINNDGYPDFFYALGTGRIFQSSLSGSTISYSGNSRITSAMNLLCGPTWGDYNNSGYPSLFIPARVWTLAPELWRNPGAPGGNFTDANASMAAGLDGSDRMQPSACWGDYDNDGYLDLFITCVNSPCLLYRNNGNGTFTRVFEGIGSYNGNPCDAKFVDVDNDGDLDLVVTMSDNGCMQPMFRIFKNMTVELTGQKNFLEVRPVVTSGGVTRTDVRARVELWLNGSFVARRDTGNASGYGGEESLIAHFGGVNPASNYTVRVYTNGKLYETTCTPNATSTTIGTTTIQQMLTVNCASSVVITQWVESAP